MNRNLFFRLTALILVLLFATALLFVSCKKDNDDSAQISTSCEITVSLMGRVVDNLDAPLPGVTMRAGNSTATTNSLGVFILENVKVSNGRYYLSAEKSGYFAGGRGGIAKQGEHYSVNVVLIKLGTPATVDGTTGGTVNTNNSGSLIFPPNAFETVSGLPYTGIVNVFKRHLSHDGAGFADRIPGGDLVSEDDNGNIGVLKSFGMMGVELIDAAGNPLKIAAGKTVVVNFPIAASQLSIAPASIPLLSFNTENGVWKQEGTAIRNGNFYEGVVSHFSWWNCDQIYDPPSTITGLVVDCNNNPVPGVTVSLDQTYSLITNAQGIYSSWIPPGTYVFEVLADYNGVIFSSSPVTVTVGTGNVTVPTLTVNCPAFITSQAVDCNGSNTPAYSLITYNGIYSKVQYSPIGTFQFLAPENTNVTVIMLNATANSFASVVSGSPNTVTSSSSIMLCSQAGGGCAGGPVNVTDVDGNVYNVVTIGDQCWMKENLKTTKYRNGTVISGNLNNSTWTNGTLGAQADYNNDSTYTSIYGKLYNWYAIANPAGLCPVGWHVPGNGDWHKLIKFLDPAFDTSFVTAIYPTSAVNMLKSTGQLQNGTGLWLGSSAAANNISGFTALPGGFREMNGIFYGINTSGYWWTSTFYHPGSSVVYYLNSSEDLLYASDDDLRRGYSVRCVRD